MEEVRALRTAAQLAIHYGSLQGKVFLVTGASNGIGEECARSLAAAGGTVVMACRAGAKAQSAADKVRARAPGAAVHLIDCDLGSPKSVRACAKAFLDLGLPLHALVNNAGINGAAKWAQHTPGIETQLAVNFLGHFLLHQLLHTTLEATPGARVVNVSSESHRRISAKGFNLKNELPPPEAAYDSLRAYAFSNLCRILWSRELARRVPYPVICLHPGVVGGTGMLQHMGVCTTLRQVWLAVWWELRPSNTLQDLAGGARTQTWCAVAPVTDLARLNGKYLSGNPDQVFCEPVETSPLGARDDLAKEVYAFAEGFFAQHGSG